MIRRQQIAAPRARTRGFVEQARLGASSLASGADHRAPSPTRGLRPAIPPGAGLGPAIDDAQAAERARAASAPPGARLRPGTRLGAPLIALFLIATAGCPSRPRRENAPALTATLVVRADVPDAVVWVDDRVVGEVASLRGRRLRLRAGAHRVEIRHDRHHTRYVEVTLRPGEHRVIEVSMAEVLP